MAIIALITYFMPSFGFAACEEIPKVAWWAGFDHDKAKRYVDRRLNGDWTRYIEIWRKQHKTLKNLHEQGKTAIVRGRRTVDGKSNRYTISLKGYDLADYVKKVKKRIEVLECLAGQAVKKAKTTSTANRAQSPAQIMNVDLKEKIEGRKLVKKFQCLKCHGDEAIEQYNHLPNLNGQNILYLARQLSVFRNSETTKSHSMGAEKRHSPFMKIRVKEFDDDVIWNIAAYFSQNRRCYSEKRLKLPSNRPEIMEQCQSCHGQHGVTSFPEIPNLAGQNKDYLFRQLLLFKNFNLNSDTDDDLADKRYHFFMSRIAKDLSKQDLVLLSDYYSSIKCR